MSNFSGQSSRFTSCKMFILRKRAQVFSWVIILCPKTSSLSEVLIETCFAKQREQLIHLLSQSLLLGTIKVRIAANSERFTLPEAFACR